MPEVNESIQAGLGNSPVLIRALQEVGLDVGGYEWHWYPGASGGIYPPHKAIDGQQSDRRDGFDGHIPRQDLNGEYCRCLIRARWVDTRQ